MIYIQRKGDGYIETIDACSSLKEARALILNYQLSDKTALYYLSRRACKAWTA